MGAGDGTERVQIIGRRIARAPSGARPAVPQGSQSGLRALSKAGSVVLRIRPRPRALTDVWGPLGYPRSPLVVRRGDSVDLGQIISGGLPLACLDVGSDLLRRGGTGNHRRHGRLRSQTADGHVEHGDRTRASEGLELFQHVEGLFGKHRLPLPCLDPTAFWSSLATSVLAGEQAARQREEGQQTDFVPFQGWDEVSLYPALQQAVFVLRADEALQVAGTRDPLSVRHLPAAEVRIAQVADLALVHEIIQRRQCLLNRGGRSGPVNLIQIDPVGT